jgi:hypothetical protein
MQYAEYDPRAHHPGDRVRYLTVLIDDADMLSRALEQHARETARSNAALSAYLHRLSTCTRDFVTHARIAFEQATPEVRKWLESN